VGRILRNSCRRAKRKEDKGGPQKKLTTAHDIYQLLVGEIGIPRHEFLYEIQFWEVRRIIRGYRRRDILKHQLLAECAYAAIYAMRDPQGKNVEDLFPSLFADDDDTEPPISEEDRQALVALMAEANSASAT
jgi:hypothetical protein